LSSEAGLNALRVLAAAYPVAAVFQTCNADMGDIISTIAGGVPPATPVAGVSASVSPGGIAADKSGTVYFSSRNSVFKLDTSGILTRVAEIREQGSPAMEAPRPMPS